MLRWHNLLSSCCFSLIFQISRETDGQIHHVLKQSSLLTSSKPIQMYLISIVIIVYYFSQWKAALAVTSSGIGIGTTYGLSGILIPELQAEANPNLRVNLHQGSYVGEEPFYSFSDRFVPHN